MYCGVVAAAAGAFPWEKVACERRGASALAHPSQHIRLFRTKAFADRSVRQVLTRCSPLDAQEWAD
jgi:hypothetical protein